MLSYEEYLKNENPDLYETLFSGRIIQHNKFADRIVICPYCGKPMTINRFVNCGFSERYYDDVLMCSCCGFFLRHYLFDTFEELQDYLDNFHALLFNKKS